MEDVISTPEASILDVGRKLSLLTEELGLLDAIKRKLMKQPDRAAAKLTTVLQELLKSLLLFESEVVKFLSISLDVSSEIGNDRAILHSLEGQALQARLKATRGHCSKIENIYRIFLDPWFQRVVDLDKKEREGLRRLFYGLSQSDSLMVDVLDDAARWLGDQAKRVLDLLEKGQLEEANKRVAEARLHILPVRRVLARTMVHLHELEADFIEMSRIT